MSGLRLGLWLGLGLRNITVLLELIDTHRLMAAGYRFMLSLQALV